MRFVFSSSLVLLAVLGSATIAHAHAQAGGRLGVSVSGVRSDSGSVRCGLYASASGFRQPGAQFRGVAARIQGGQANCVFSAIPPGTYAVAVFHAEQGETRMETGAFGKPKQGYGFSRNPSSSFGPPEFTDAAFEYRGGSMSVPVRLQY